MFSRFDCILMGRKTFEISQTMADPNAPDPFAGMEQHVFSRTPAKGQPLSVVREIRKREGKDIWLMGGGELAAEFLKEDLIDGISLAVCPILLGSGTPLFAAGFPERQFRFVKQRLYSKSGIITLDYERA
jgi:dihydrofolate reductase